jgi:outer membrane protein assembly factor BamA
MRRFCYFCTLTALFLVVPAVQLMAQAVPDPGASVRQNDTVDFTPPELDSFEGVLIDSLVIEPHNVFGAAESGGDNLLFRTANKLHIVTRAHVIKRDVLLKKGELFSQKLAEETARNLRTRYDLYDAWILPELLPSGKLLVRVVTQDQWSLLVGARIRRDGNLTNYEFSLEDRNLLGQNQFLSFAYYIQDQDGNYLRTVFSDQRFRGYPCSVELTYNSNPTDRLKEIEVSHPFYNLAQQLSYGARWGDEGGRIDYYRDNLKVGQTRREGDNFELNGHYRWGSYNRKIGVLGGYQYRYQRFFDHQGDTAIIFPSDSLVNLVRAGVSFDNIVYTQVRRVNGFSYTEDVTLGQSLELSYGRGFRERFGGFLFDELALGSSVGYKFNQSLLLMTTNFAVWFRQRENLHHAADLTARYYNTNLSFMTVALRGRYSVDVRSDNREPLYLGGSSGIRGYDKYSLTGNKLAVGNMEFRFFPRLEVLSVMFGGALFADVGRTWKTNEGIGLSGYHASVGAGLRISAEHAFKQDILRLDVAKAQGGHWQLSFGTGQYF